MVCMSLCIEPQHFLMTTSGMFMLTFIHSQYVIVSFLSLCFYLAVNISCAISNNFEVDLYLRDFYTIKYLILFDVLWIIWFTCRHDLLHLVDIQVP